MPTDHELAVEFAPVMNLHPGERYFPMDAEAFVTGCRLCLVQDRPRSGFERIAVLNLTERSWDLDPDESSHFGVPVSLLADWSQLHGPDDASWSRRPQDSSLAEDGQLFALEHHADKPSVPFDPSSPPTCYYHVQPWRDSTLISYWFFYGYSRFLAGFAHQGDWEHATLRVRDGELISGFYAVHEAKYYVEAEDLEFRDGRLQVYSAKNRHATWWKEGDHSPGIALFKDKEAIENLRSADRALIQDETARGGHVWDVRLDLKPLGEQPWRLYAGAWGKLGSGASGTGPLGPWYKRHLDPQDKVILE
jgi:hypothetical protein